MRIQEKQNQVLIINLSQIVIWANTDTSQHFVFVLGRVGVGMSLIRMHVYYGSHISLLDFKRHAAGFGFFG